MPRLITSNKGKEKLVDDDNYMYNLHKLSSDKGTRFWRCEKVKRCNVRVHTLESDSTKIIKTFGNHTHKSDAAIVASRIALQEMKALAKSQVASTKEIVQSSLAAIDSNTNKRMPSEALISRRLYYARQKEKERTEPPIPTKRYGFSIPDQYKKLCDGRAFLQYDSGINDEERILIFATDESLEELSMVKQWAVDQTLDILDTVDIPFDIVSVHVMHRTIAFPSVYGLLPNKNSATYDRFWEILNEICGSNLQPEYVISNCECIFRTSFEKAFPFAHINLCLHKLTESIYNNVIESGFVDTYHTDESFSIDVRCLVALAFVPLDDVNDVYGELISTISIPTVIKDFFELFYMGHINKDGQWADSLCPAKYWNVFERIIGDQPVINNSSDGWHRSMRIACRSAKPSIWSIIRGLNKDQMNSENQRDKMKAGGSFGFGKKIQVIQKIKTAMLNYENDPVKCLCTIANYLKGFCDEYYD